VVIIRKVLQGSVLIRKVQQASSEWL